MCGEEALTLAFAAIGGVSMVTGHAALAVGARGEVAALLAHAAVDARAVAVALARCGAEGGLITLTVREHREMWSLGRG